MLYIFIFFFLYLKVKKVDYKRAAKDQIPPEDQIPLIALLRCGSMHGYLAPRMDIGNSKHNNLNKRYRPLGTKRYAPADGHFGPFRRLGDADDHGK